MTAFVKAMGGTAWAGSQTQYYETVNGQNIYIQNPTDVFGDLAEAIADAYPAVATDRDDEAEGDAEGEDDGAEDDAAVEGDDGAEDDDNHR